MSFLNPWQLTRQLAYALRAATWPDAPTEKLFGAGAVAAVPVDPSFLALDNRGPLALVRAEAEEHRPGAPQLVERASWRVHLFAVGAGTQAGAGALAGGPRTGGVGSSKGRGVLELEEVVADVLRTRVLGRLRVVSKGAASSPDVPSGLATRDLQVIATRLPQARSYHPARRFAASVAGPDVTLTWTVPPDRWDRLRMVLRYQAGGVAPATATDGTGVVLGADLATSVVHAPGAGTWSYALFAAYDENGDLVADRFSSAVTKTVTV